MRRRHVHRAATYDEIVEHRYQEVVYFAFQPIAGAAHEQALGFEGLDQLDDAGDVMRRGATHLLVWRLGKLRTVARWP